MAYDRNLTRRIRETLGDMPELVEKEMFGGVGFLLNGNMACGVLKDRLIVRVGAENHATALARPHALTFDMRGRPMKGWVMVEAAGVATEQALKKWVLQGVAFVRTLPPK